MAWLLSMMLAMAADAPPLLGCNGTVAPLMWSDLSGGPAPPLPATTRPPSLAHEGVRAPFVAVDADGQLSQPLPEGPVLVAIDDALPGPRIVALYERFLAAGSTPYEVLRADEGVPDGSLVRGRWDGWPKPVTGWSFDEAPEAFWTERLRGCRAGKRLLKSSCAQRAERWAAVVADPACGLREPLDAPVYTPGEGALRLAPIPVDPRVVTHQLTTETRWEDLRARPPRAVTLVDPPPPPPPLLDNERVFHASEVEVRHRVEPTYPEAVRGMGLGDWACHVALSIDERGVPTTVHAVTDCPEVFHASAEQTVLAWRWHPPKEGSEARRARVKLGLRFREPGL